MITAYEKNEIRTAVYMAMDLWPNAHLGDCSRQEDLKSAFRFIRRFLDRGFSISAAASELQFDTIRYEDM